VRSARATLSQRDRSSEPAATQAFRLQNGLPFRLWFHPCLTINQGDAPLSALGDSGVGLEGAGAAAGAGGVRLADALEHGRPSHVLPLANAGFLPPAGRRGGTIGLSPLENAIISVSTGV
jgi:hypothetical protein